MTIDDDAVDRAVAAVIADGERAKDGEGHGGFVFGGDKWVDADAYFNMEDGDVAKIDGRVDLRRLVELVLRSLA